MRPLTFTLQWSPRMDSPTQDQAGRRSRGGRIGLIVLLYASLTLLFAYPLSLNMTTLRLPTGPDGDLCMWILGWDAHAFIHQPLSIFEANIYYPQHLTLAYAENLIGSALFAAPVVWLTGNLTLASNFIGLLSCVLCGLGAYVLARRVGVGVAGAVLSGLIFAFSPPRFFRIGQLHLAAVQWIPFGLAALHAYLDGGRKRDLRLAAGFFTLQALSSGYGAVFMSFSMAGLLAYRVALGEPMRPIRRLRDLGLTGAALLAPTVYVFLQYRAVQLDVGLRRGLGGWGVTPASFIASPSHLQQFVLAELGAGRVNQLADAFLFPGYLPLLLAAVALGWRRRSIVAGTTASSAGPDAAVEPGRAASPVSRTGQAVERVNRRDTGRAESPVSSPERRAMAPVAASEVSARRARPDRRIEPDPPGPAPHDSPFSAWWGRTAVTLNLLALGCLVLAVIVARTGPVRVRLGGVLLFSAREATRLLVAGAAFLVARLALVPFSPPATLRWIRRLGGASLRTADRIPPAVAGSWRRVQSFGHRLVEASRRGVARVQRVVAALARAVEPVRRRASRLSVRLSPIRRWAATKRRDVTIFYGLLAIVSYWLAVGPPFGLWQFVYWLPGFTFIRECSRFTIVGLLGLAILSGIGFDRLTVHLSSRRSAALAWLTGLCLLAEFAAMPLAVQPTTAIVPAVDRWLDTQPKPFVVAEVPAPRPSLMGPFERQQAAYMIHSTAHWQKTVQGYSGWRTPLHEALYQEMQDFPNEKVLDTLSRLDVTYIVVHTELYPPGEWARVENLIGRFTTRLNLVHVEGQGRVYALRRLIPGVKRAD